ncbi:MinD/ParA family ATP-binding protein [Halorubellus salinus]|uniref:MinD/ParA family ATP-binding protein n=1 Tax=Halorubellus salinus TaxID=755309 RepID=UPI001D06C913|nr:cell division inhibitor MinD [Halorubellus salinus]
MLAFAGGKGGTGKTTTALAFARELSAARTHDGRRRTVTVVDADVDMPDVHAMVGVDRTPTVLECPRGRPAPSLSGVRVAPAPPADATDAFERALSELRAPDGTSGDRNATGGRSRRCVVVDAPCGGGPDAARPLAAADGVVLVTRPTPAAVRDTAKTAAMARALETPVVAAVVVGDRPPRALEDVLGAPRVVTVPVVDDDPLTAPAHRAAVGRLCKALRRGRHLFTE